jgi:hypothetical protein
VARTRTQASIDAVAMWTALVVYAVIWIVGLQAGLETMWLPAAVTIIYVAMHIYEITQRSHCYLSADSTAAPCAAGFYFLAIAVSWLIGKPISFFHAWTVFIFVFFGAHLVALVYAAALTTALEYVYRNRITSERATNP